MKKVDGKTYVKEDELRYIFGRLKGVIDEFTIVYPDTEMRVSIRPEGTYARYSVFLTVGESTMVYDSPRFTDLEEVME